MKEVSEINVNVGELVTTSSAKIAKQFNPFGGDNLAVEIPPADEEPKNYILLIPTVGKVLKLVKKISESVERDGLVSF